VIHKPLLSLMFNEDTVIKNKLFSFWMRTGSGFVSLLYTHCELTA
jgi:hypothetical protein